MSMFDRIALQYDALNGILSLGMDIGWRRAMIQELPAATGLQVLDLATGTADVAILLAQDARVARVVGIDVADKMLEIGAGKVQKAGLSEKIELRNIDACALPFPQACFDVVTVAFGVRNFPDLMRGLMEARRVLKPGGRFLVLEFSAPQNPILKPFHAVYLHGIVPFLGGFLARDLKAYQYLSRTIRMFPYGEQFSRILKQVGFTIVSRVELALGAVTMYRASL
ncbi:MAG: bifunctional demethylmenaquinone methyltransferase/2-methoxy-6-polyprenyl-1,4-benzoquinol methylase UbiE [Candidatus Omnitrophica bacterium]|nr:bifunctional demethylmenaquinone methyltransferase/2-methoxy-6-polyprenyl-1,4-benzoquinol methylase UbiE [Candidatus Omnitrophota bacterium]